ncbi:ATP-binding protein, partial [Bacillus thuringiensis]|nr:ATP-binding protein [Bacillus thuringiensis]
MRKDTYDDKRSKYTLQEYVRVIGQDDLVVLDDQGEGSGAKESNRQESDFI